MLNKYDKIFDKPTKLGLATYRLGQQIQQQEKAKVKKKKLVILK